MSLCQLYLIWTWNWVSTDKQLLVVAVLSAPLLVSLCLAAPLPSSAAAFKCAPVSVTGGHPAASEPRDGLTAAMFCPRRTSAATEVSLSKRLPLYPAGEVRRKDCPPALSPRSLQLALINVFFFLNTQCNFFSGARLWNDVPEGTIRQP